MHMHDILVAVTLIQGLGPCDERYEVATMCLKGGHHLLNPAMLVLQSRAGNAPSLVEIRGEPISLMSYPLALAPLADASGRRCFDYG